MIQLLNEGAASRGRVEHANCRLCSPDYTHGIYGPFAYTVFSDISLSACGDLYLATFVPQKSRHMRRIPELGGQKQPSLGTDALVESQSSLQRLRADEHAVKERGCLFSWRGASNAKNDSSEVSLGADDVQWRENGGL